MPATSAPAPVPSLRGYGTAPVNCSSCGATFTGRWACPEARTEQACPSCGTITLAAWPGWTPLPDSDADAGEVG
jgi:hypothetical protein